MRRFGTQMNYPATSGLAQLRSLTRPACLGNTDTLRTKVPGALFFD